MRRISPIGVLLRALLVVLGIAAAIGLGIVFAGPQDTVTKVLVSVLVLGGALLLAVPAALVPLPALRWGMGALVGVEAVLVWILIWGPEPPEALARASAMIGVLLVVLAVAIVVQRVTRGPRVRGARIVGFVSMAAGAVMLGLAWAMIITDGDAGVPGRVMAGVGIIYAATALGAVVLAAMRSFAVVRRT